MTVMKLNVGETKQALKSMVYQHKNPSSNEAQNSAIYLHLRETGQSINTKDTTILDKEEHTTEGSYLGKSGITITQQEGD